MQNIPGKGIVKRIVESGFKPLFQQYAVTKIPKRFTDTAKALELLSPLMQKEEDANYHRGHVNRYLVTMEYLLDLPKTTRVLEIGAPPYGMTVLMRQWMFEHLAITGYDEKASTQLGRVSEQEVQIKDLNGTVIYEGQEKRFNLELQKWPFGDEEFDLVISCETFEHLGLDPMHAYSEANRVLKSGGRLFLTVPNGLSFSNGVRYLGGAQPNSFPYYRPEGFSLRHLREPTPAEVGTLMRAAGFEVEFIETVNMVTPSLPCLSRMIGLSLLCRPLDMRREIIAARGIKRGPVVERYPTACELYFPWDVLRISRK